jgi:hypothetical protein
MSTIRPDPDSIWKKRRFQVDNPPLPVSSGLPPRLMSDIDPQSDLFGLSPEKRRDLMLDLAGGRYTNLELVEKYSISKRSVQQFKNRIMDVLEISAFARNVRDGMEARETLMWMLGVSREVIERAKEEALKFEKAATKEAAEARAEARALLSDHLARMLSAVAMLGEVTGEIVPASVRVAKVNRSRDVKLARMGALPAQGGQGGPGSAQQPLQILALPRTYQDAPQAPPAPSKESAESTGPSVPAGDESVGEETVEKRNYSTDPCFPFGSDVRVRAGEGGVSAQGGSSPLSEDSSDELLDVPLPEGKVPIDDSVSSDLSSDLTPGTPGATGSPGVQVPGPTSPAGSDQPGPLSG